MTYKIDYEAITKAYESYKSKSNKCPYLIVEDFRQGLLTLIKSRSERWGSLEKEVRILSLTKL